MRSTDIEAVTERVERTLNAATRAVAEKQEWAQRIRENWVASERPEHQAEAQEVVPHVA